VKLTPGNSSEAKAGSKALPLLEKLFPEQGLVTAAYMSHCSSCNFLVRCETANCEATRLAYPIAVLLNLWFVVMNILVALHVYLMLVRRLAKITFTKKSKGY
jgi:hypothetical protein